MTKTTQEYRIGDNLKLLAEMPADSIDTIITSPPYLGLKDYGVGGQIGLESTMTDYHDKLLAVTAELQRVLKPTGVMFWNHGDSYGGSGGSGGDYGKGGSREGQPKVGRSIKYPAKCMMMQNERLVIKMIDDQGWILRNRIIWNKTNSMASYFADRLTNMYEPIFMFVKNRKYTFDISAVQISTKDGNGKKNMGDVWNIPTKKYKGSHFAVFPTTLVEPMIKAACPEGGTVLDPFAGSGTVGEVARSLNRNAILLELNPEYAELIEKRIGAGTPQISDYENNKN